MTAQQNDIFPASFAQQRLWFLDQLQPGNAAYNVSSVQRLRGVVNVPVLEQSLNEIVRRHEALRTRFEDIDGEPMQVLETTLWLKLNVEDLSSESACEEVELEKIIEHHARQQTLIPFNLSEVPLLRLKLLRMGAEDHVLLLTLHHIVSDGWSLSILHGELAQLYEAYCAGQESPLAELGIQYADFSVWQREWLQGAVLEEQLSYWKQQLAGAPAVLALPTDFTRPAVQSNKGQLVTFVLERELTEGLKELSRQQNVTLFMTLLAAFQILLNRYSGQEDVVVGTPIAGRNREEVEPLIGFFVNTLVLRTKLGGNPRFTELLEQVKEAALAAYAHQDVPFEKLVEELRGERSLSYGPLFQVLFVLQNMPHEGLEFGGLRMEEMEIGSELAKFDLMLSLKEQKGELKGWLQYNKDLFRGETIERMRGHWQVLLEGIVAHPEQRVGELPLLSSAEREQLLVQFNETRVGYVELQQTIHGLFEAQVERQPAAVAVRFGAQQVSYEELNRRANQVAWRLRRCGVGPEVLVGVLLERSVALVVGLLGVLKAGGAYVPLDGSYPEERLRFMVADAGVGVLLTEEKLRGRVSGAGLQAVYLDGAEAESGSESEANPESGVGAENLAYVIYTSGSTGRPKGTMVRHRSVLNLKMGLDKAVYADSLGTQLRVSLNGPTAFDTSVKQLLQLLNGHTLYILPEEARRDGEALLSYVRQHSLDVLDSTPSMLSLLIDAGLLASPKLLPKVVLVGGEPIELPMWQALTKPTEANFYNLYGPTECTVDATLCRVTDHFAQPSIGRPLANYQIYILDEQLQLVPVGVSGELHIAGEGLARGYLGRAEATAEKFVPHPYSESGGARLYRTGDIGRYRADGEIEYQGRRDQQVKVRGFRIELGEVEAVLRQHAGIREAVVLAREDEPGDKRLVAYLVSESELSVSELREWLKQKLPEYMVPTGYVWLAELPLTANGKVDRAALPAPEGTRPELADSYVAPRTAIEEVVAGIWSEVLKVERVGMHDNFFELGGHSLLAVQVVSRLQRNFEVEIPLRRLFESPSTAQLSAD